MRYRKKDFLDLQAHAFAWALFGLLAHITEVNVDNNKCCYIPNFFHSNERKVNLARTDISCITVMGLKANKIFFLEINFLNRLVNKSLLKYI